MGGSSPRPCSRPTTYPLRAGRGRLQRRRPARPGREQLRGRRRLDLPGQSATGPSSRRRTSRWGPRRRGIAAADLTGDGRADLVTTDLINLTVHVLLGQRRRDLPGAAASRRSPTSPRERGRGRPHRQRHPGPDRRRTTAPTTCRSCWAGATAPSARRSSSRSAWGLRAWRSATSTATASRTWPSPNSIEDTVSILLGNGDGTFRPGEKLVDGDPAVPTSRRPTWTGDGTLDLVVSNVHLRTRSRSSTATATARSRTRSSSRPGASRATPSSPTSTATAGPTSPSPPTSSAVTIYMATGPRTYAPPRNIPAGPGRERGWRSATSPATAFPTWSSPTPTRSTPRTSRSCWATATAPSAPARTFAVGDTPVSGRPGRLHRRRQARHHHRQRRQQRPLAAHGRGRRHLPPRDRAPLRARSRTTWPSPTSTATAGPISPWRPTSPAASPC